MRNLFKLSFILLLSICAKAQVNPLVSIINTSTANCTSVPYTFSANPLADPLSYTWAVVPVKGLTAYTDLNSPTLSLTFYNTITYTVYLNVANEAGLTYTAATTVSPSRSSKASFNASFFNSGYPTQLILTNYSSHSTKNYWKFSDTEIQDTSLNTVKDYSVSGNYMVRLVTIGSNGCNDSTDYTFRIADSSGVTLPNVFTPNGDGANDVFKPITSGIYELNAWIYNRYGQIVANWDKPKGSWDGHSTSGEECSDGIYVIVLEAKGFDGKDYKLKGTITLIR